MQYLPYLSKTLTEKPFSLPNLERLAIYFGDNLRFDKAAFALDYAEIEKAAL